jgi:hypothetical protein
MPKYYNIQLAYVEDEDKVGAVKYVKQILNQKLEITNLSHTVLTCLFKIDFPKDMIPGSETVYNDGMFIPSEEYDLETGFYANYTDAIYCTYSVVLDQKEGKADHLDMPNLGVIELGGPEEEEEDSSNKDYAW